MRISFVVLVACSSPHEPVPDSGAPLEPIDLPDRGTFCYTLDGGEHCTTGTAARVLDAGLTWFDIDAALTLAVTNDGTPVPTPTDLRLRGSLVPDASLPALASAGAVVVPVVALCHRVVLIDPFGTCAMRDAEVVCKLDATGDESEVLVQVLDDRIGGTFRATLELDSLGCCASTPACANPAQQLDPVPTEIRGRFLL